MKYIRLFFVLLKMHDIKAPQVYRLCLFFPLVLLIDWHVTGTNFVKGNYCSDHFMTMEFSEKKAHFKGIIFFFR